MRGIRNLWFAIFLLVLMGLAGTRASDQDETVLTAQVSAAEHEVAEGYFSLGDAATVMVKPGSDLYRFLVRQRGHSIKLTLTGSTGRHLSRVDRDPSQP
jgi:hypothetical protein